MVWCVVCGVCSVWCIVYSEKRTWDVRFVFRCLCVCVVCGVVYVARLGTRKAPAVCRFKTAPCVHSKRPRVCRQNARICYHMRAFCRYTRKRFEPTHGCVLNTHTGGLSLSPSFFLSSFVLFLFSLSARHSFFLSLLVSLFFFSVSSQALCVSVLNDNNNDRSSSWLSLSHCSDLP